MAIDLAGMIEKELSILSKKTIKAVGDSAKKVASNGAKKLKSTSPKLEGKYAAGWASRKKSSFNVVSYTVYNRARPSLTHLLEKGHSTKNGTGRVAAQPHIEPVEKEMIEEFEAEIIRGIED